MLERLARRGAVVTDESAGVDTDHDVRQAIVREVVARADVAVDELVDEDDVRAADRP